MFRPMLLLTFHAAISYKIASVTFLQLDVVAFCDAARGAAHHFGHLLFCAHHMIYYYYLRHRYLLPHQRRVSTACAANSSSNRIVSLCDCVVGVARGLGESWTRYDTHRGKNIRKLLHSNLLAPLSTYLLMYILKINCSLHSWLKSFPWPG